MVDGQVVNCGAGLPIVGQTGGYTADIAHAQEINIQVSGALGESETGGASINIVPRTGGNRYRRRLQHDLHAATTGSTATPAHTRASRRLFQAVISRSRHVGAFGGPIKRDRLWFFASGARPGHPQAAGRRRLLAEPERRQVGLQLSARSRGAARRVQEHLAQRQRALHLAGDAEEQVQHLLGRAGLLPGPVRRRRVGLHVARVVVVGRRSSRTGCSRCRGRTRSRTGSCSRPASASTRQHYDTTQHREYTNPIEIPRVVELGDTAGHGQRRRRASISSPATPVLPPDVRLARTPASAAARRRDSRRPTTTARGRRCPTSPAATTPSSATTAATTRSTRPTRSTTCG